MNQKSDAFCKQTPTQALLAISHALVGHSLKDKEQVKPTGAPNCNKRLIIIITKLGNVSPIHNSLLLCLSTDSSSYLGHSRHRHDDLCWWVSQPLSHRHHSGRGICFNVSALQGRLCFHSIKAQNHRDERFLLIYLASREQTFKMVLHISSGLFMKYFLGGRREEKIIV